MAADNLDSADLKAVAVGGVIKEDVMNQIWDISRIPLPFTDLIGAPDPAGNENPTWVVDRLADPDTTNAKVDGQDLTDNDENPPGPRVGNHCQISTKRVSVSTRARNSDTIGGEELARQVMRRQQELRRDVEAISLTIQGSQADDGNSTPGLSAGLQAWIETNVDVGTGTVGGFNEGTGFVDDYTPGARRAPTLEMLKTVIEDCWIGGGDPTVIMSVATVIRRLSEYMFDDTAKIATLQSDAGQSQSQMTAKGSVNVYIADHGQVLEFSANRLQQTYQDSGAAEAAGLFVLDPGYARHAHLHGYRVEEQGKTGLADKRQMAVDWCLKCLNEEAHGMITDIDPTAAWTAG